MKKVLFATTALVVSAGFASAQGVALSGSAEMGIIGGDGVDESFFTDIDVTFTMSGETDNGLTFGASIDLDESDGSNSTCTSPAHGAGDADPGSTCTILGASNAFSGATQGGETIFLSGSFGTITMGDTDGAFDWALTEIGSSSAGSINDEETSHAGYNGNSGLDGDYDGQILRYDYTFSGLGVAISIEMDDSSNEYIYGLGGRYTFDFAGGSVGVGLGYQADTGTDATLAGLTLDAQLDSGFRGTFQYSQGDSNNGGIDETYYGIGAGYSFDAFSVHANYGMYEEDGGDQNDGFGLSAAYDLGGGASIHLGYGSGSDGGANTGGFDGDRWSFGVAMSF